MRNEGREKASEEKVTPKEGNGVEAGDGARTFERLSCLFADGVTQRGTPPSRTSAGGR